MWYTRSRVHYLPRIYKEYNMEKHLLQLLILGILLALIFAVAPQAADALREFLRALVVGV